MTLQIVRLSHLAVYLWMLGITLTLVGQVLFTRGGEAVGIIYLGFLIMITGLLVAVFHPFLEGLVFAVREWRGVDNRGEGQ